MRLAVAIVFVTSSVAICGCSTPSKNTVAAGYDHVAGFDDVYDAGHFWARVWEMERNRQGADFMSAPTTFKECVGREMVQMTPLAITAAIERFIKDKRVANYEALFRPTYEFSEEYEKEHGVKPQIRAAQVCADQLNSQSAFVT